MTSSTSKDLEALEVLQKVLPALKTEASTAEQPSAAAVEASQRLLNTLKTGPTAISTLTATRRAS